MTTTTEQTTIVEITTQELFEVNFNSMGESSVDSLYLHSGSCIPIPTVEREGYTFDGWYIDSKLTTLYNFGLMPSKDLILYGKWSLDT